jgi:hypothetical protein
MPAALIKSSITGATGPFVTKTRTAVAKFRATASAPPLRQAGPVVGDSGTLEAP